MKTPDFSSWLTLQPFIKKATARQVFEMLLAESRIRKREYVLKRLISAYLSKERASLRKKYIKPARTKKP